MQDEIAAAVPAAEIQILGVNQIGQDPAGANAWMCEGKDLPWLQERRESPVWNVWHVTYRDVIVLDGENVITRVYNLSEHDLGNPANYAALRTILLEAWDREDR